MVLAFDLMLMLFLHFNAYVWFNCDWEILLNLGLE